MTDSERETWEALCDPFPERLVHWKPQSVSGNRCLAVAYVDARLVADRLTTNLGLLGWKDSYEFLPDNMVLCRLSVRLWWDACHDWSEWISREDVGGPSEQPDESDRVKAAVSDALKRAAVKFGIARYLYDLPPTWVDYDPQKKRIVKAPRLPDWAVPKEGRRTKDEGRRTKGPAAE